MILDEYVKKNPYLFTDAVRANAEILRGGLATGPECADFSDDIAKAMEGDPE